MDFNGQKSTPYIVDILHQHGVDQVVICPGSRNAPLTLAFARHKKFNCLSIIDERSAGYFALGLSQATNKPVALVCTSGTATLNFAPAIAEAYHQHVPLIVLTADRPEAWIGQKDGQAMNQKNIYANIIARSYHLTGELYCQDDLWYTERIVNEATGIAILQSKPVHINCAFAEPLYNEEYHPVKAKKVSFLHSPLNFSNWEKVLEAKKNNILIVIGQAPYHEGVKEAAEKIQSCSNVVFVAENLANIPAANYIHNATEASIYIKQKPDVVIYFGGPIVSKQLKKYISNTGAPIIRVQTDNDVVDTFKNNVAVVVSSLVDGIESLSGYLLGIKVKSDFSASWKSASEKAVSTRNIYLAEIKFSDLKVFEILAKLIPTNSNIHLGNSTPVRYAQLMNDLYKENCRFYSNRGTSGIDGSTSTASGFSYANSQLNFLITGDLSFQYDANAFFNQHFKGNLKVIIINNSGGNIFRVIDGPRDLPERENYFETSLNHEFSNLAKHFNLNYFKAENEKDLSLTWDDFVKTDNDRPSVLEIFTDAAYSAETYKNFYQYIQKS